MDYLIGYAIFAVATSITSLYELVHPILKDKDFENRIMHYLVFLLINILAAPLIFLSCIIPSWGDRFRVTLEESLFPKE